MVPVLLTVTLFALFACCCPGQRAVPIAAPPEPPRPALQVPVPVDVVPAKESEAQMQNVRFHIDSTTALHIYQLRGQMFDKQSGQPLDLDDKHSFVVRIFTAHIGADATSLTSMMNRYVFSGSNVKNVTVAIHDGHLYPEGTIHKIIDIPFRMTADVSQSNGLLRIHPTRIEICNLNAAALMKAFGLSLAKVIGKLPRGVRVSGNDLLVDPLAIIPSPTIEGKLAAAQIEGNEMTQDFDDGRDIRPLQPPEAGAKNYMYFEHGTLRMGKLFMVSADMQVVDTDQSDPFDFSIDRYNEQLVAGYDHNRANYGLTVYMRDLEDVGKPARPGERLAP